MRDILMIGGLITLLSITAHAQSGTHDRRMKRSGSILTYSSQLGLTDAQKVKLWDVESEASQHRKSLKSEAETNNRSTHKKIMKENRELYEKKIAEILSEEQNDTLERLRAEEIQFVKAKKDERKKSRTLIKQKKEEYFNDNILPIMGPIRREFDEELSEQERDVIAKVHQNRGDKEKNKANRIGRKEDAPLSKSQLKKGLLSIVQNHQEAISKIERDNLSLLNEWQEEIRKMNEKMDLTKNENRSRRSNHPEPSFAMKFLLMRY